MKKLNILLLGLLAILWLSSAAKGAIIVGRLTNVEGQVYRYMEVDQSWVETFPDSPVGTQDILATGAGARAEIQFPNAMLARLDENTHIEILELRADTGVFRLQNGLSRFYNHNETGSLIIATTRGRVKIEPESAIDIQGTEENVTVAAVYGQAVFQSDENGVASQEIISGNSSLTFTSGSIIAGRGPIDRNWDRWCNGRDAVLAQNLAVHSDYLPETMQQYASVVEPYGNWHRIYYRGYYYWGWQPRVVSAGWAPYTTGYWYDWHNEPVWIDYNPWGWVTHHHGHWLHVNGAWMWTPYVHVANVPGISVVGFSIQFGKKYRSHWHPGRVRWISERRHIGWLPLAPGETYYGHRHWGPKSVVMSENIDLSINLSLANHTYINYAVIIPKQDFQRRRPVRKDHYNNIRIRNIDTTMISRNYKPSPVAEEYRPIRHTARITKPVRRSNQKIVQPKKSIYLRQETNQPINKLTKEARRTSSKKNHLQRQPSSIQKQTVAKKNFSPEKKTTLKTVRSESQNKVRRSDIQLKRAAFRGTSSGTRVQKPDSNETRVKNRTKVTRQAVIIKSKRSSANRNNQVFAGQYNSRKQMQQQSDGKSRQKTQKVERTKKTDENRQKYAVKAGQNNPKQQNQEQRQRGTRTFSTNDDQRDRQSGGRFSASFKDRMLR
jgi:hypothetical protein